MGLLENCNSFCGWPNLGLWPKGQKKNASVNRIPVTRTRALETLKGARLVAREQSARERRRDGDRARARAIERDREQRK